MQNVTNSKKLWIYDILFVLILVLAGYLRFTGANWGQGGPQHPDENFFSGVLDSLRAHKCSDEAIPVDACPLEQQRWMSLLDYLDSPTSTLNPYNRGYNFYVYGNLPMTLTRIAVEMVHPTDIRIFGRQASAMADLFAVALLYLIVARLYDRRTALLATLFSAFTVMQIQQSHFFTTDSFVNPFTFLAIYFAVEIITHKPDLTLSEPIESSAPNTSPVPGIFQNNLFLFSLGFGFAYGMALASKVNIYPLAILLPMAFLIRYFINKPPDDVSLEFGNLNEKMIDSWLLVVSCLIAGALAALISFRIFQPYAFDGLLPSQQWIANIKEQRIQAKGDSDVPWSLQWARRSHLYSFTNLTSYGLGLPLGILAWVGFLYMGWRILKGEWQHVLLWGWTAAYFFWQSLQFNPTMRYQLPIYPLLAMMAAWVAFEPIRIPQPALRNAAQILRGLGVAVVVLLTAAWAFAFQSIYTRDEPRIAASRWIYQNIPAPINLKIQDSDASTYNQPLAFPTGIYIRPEEPYQTSFTPQVDGDLQEILLAHVAAVPNGPPAQLYLTLWQNLNDPQPLASAYTIPSTVDVSNGTAQTVNFDQPPALTANQTYYVKFELGVPEAQVNVCGSMQLMIQAVDQTTQQSVSISAPCTVTSDSPYTITFVPQVTGTLNVIELEHVTNADLSTLSNTHTLSVSVSNDPNLTNPLASASIDGTFASINDPRGEAVNLELDQPVTLTKGTQYYLRFEASEGALTFSGANISNETDYDYALPFRVDGYDAFGGLYRGDLNLQVYWDDNADKLNRFVDILSQTDYILIPTNHQYAQITRVPERYPLTAYYYRELMGCPPDMETIPCYHEAKPGDYKGLLGFDLVVVFETFPKLGNIEINDEYAEEAFTFYDHPKAFVFKKNADFDAEKLRASLSTVDVTQAIHLLPRQFADYSTLELPPERLATQRAGGTWSQLFNYDWIQNRYPVIGLLIWYVFIFILGLATYPIIRLAMPGLADKGYPLSRALGLVIFGYLAWMAGSVGIQVTRITVGIVFGALVLIGLVLGYLQRAELSAEWKTKRKYFLMVEGLFLLFFLIDLLIRIGNPDMWHPGKGGERPMDFSYFNAVIKSTTFPPYDPWYAGGYINYYYYGFVLVAMPVKLLGIVPTIAYNFILPTLFAMVGSCAFSIGWNLLTDNSRPQPEKVELENEALDPVPELEVEVIQPLSFVAGLSAALLTILFGNLGTLQLIYNGLQQLGSLGTFSWESTFSQRLMWASEGLKMIFNGASLSIGPGNWYWDPSRVVPPGPGNAITEFPLFTFIYSDLHAHMMVMPIALLAISWALSVVAGRAWKQNQASPESGAGTTSNRWVTLILSLLVGGLVIGAAYPANLSDAYTYLLIGVIALMYAIWRYVDADMLIRLGLMVGAAALLYVLSKYMYLPYRMWYVQAYSALEPWRGPFTPLASYFTHWGVFLFIIVAWLAWETREWMAYTPFSALKKLKPYQLLIEGSLILFVFILFALQFVNLLNGNSVTDTPQPVGTSVGWIALPIAAWAGVLLLNPSMSDTKRLVLFLIGTAMFITILVEVVVVRGDIGRQNTIFKFYLQAWLMLAVSAGAALAWTLPAYPQWLPGWRGFWQTGLLLLLGGAALYTFTGAGGKIRDRWNADAPRTLDAITFMNYVNYDDFGQRLNLSEDYHAIRWMQDNVQGSPVIVEANCPEYRWCTRFTIYTGLPGVVGWNWHQRQQRVFTSIRVEERVAAIGNFYNSVDEAFTRTFLQTYDVKYIVVGQLERAEYTPEGIAKFEQWDGRLWKSVYQDGSTVIYEVIQ